MPEMQGFRELVGYSVPVWRSGYAEVVVELGVHHTNRMGIVHGGVYMTILDAAMGHAATWAPTPAERKRCVTISMTTSFLKPAQGGKIRAIGEMAGVHDGTVTCRGRVMSTDGVVLMSAQASFRLMSGTPTR
ncbi:MAG: PaaI family thioesterase [Pseudomonadota bacterium]